MSKADEDYAFGLYPDGSGVLRNRFGLRDAGALQAVEYQVTTDRERDAPVFPLTREGYQALHRHLFQEVFDWAGELRTVNFGKGGSRFATARYLDATLDTLFTELASRNYLRGRTGERFAGGAAHHISELNVAHPFREGNGRTMRLHLSQLAEQAGHALDVTRMAGPAWIEASIRGFEGDERPLASLIAGALAPERRLRPDDARDTPRDAGLTIMAALRGPAPKDGAPWDAAPTSMAARLAEYEARRAAEAAAKAAASPAAAPDPAPTAPDPAPMAPAQPKPRRDPGPGF